MSDTVPVNVIATSAARRIILAAEKKAESIGVPSTIAVCDSSGLLKELTRMDGSPVLCLQIAQDKAYTAIGFSMPTHAWHDFIKDDAPLSAGAPTGIGRLILFGGGYPITIDGETVGGIGVSGGHWSQDMEIAEAGLAALEGG